MQARLRDTYIYITLKTEPNPPSPTLYEEWKPWVAAFNSLEENTRKFSWFCSSWHVKKAIKREQRDLKTIKNNIFYTYKNKTKRKGIYHWKCLPYVLFSVTFSREDEKQSKQASENFIFLFLAACYSKVSASKINGRGK